MLEFLKLSICVATYNRAAYIAETLDAIVSQLPANVELVVVDGASPDNTEAVVARCLHRHPHIRYVRETENSGVDRDFDKAIGYARGEYCWLMSDDDLLAPGAVRAVLNRLDESPELVVVNAQVRSKDLSVQLRSQLLPADTPTQYGTGEHDRFLANVGDYLTFIGAVVIRRSAWLAREREPYMGTLFIHAGVIFQAPPLSSIRVVREPLITIRYGNAMWTARGFEIWMYKWPRLVWSFTGYSDEAKQRVTLKHPDNSLAKLAWFRGIGAYDVPQYHQFIATQSDWRVRVQAQSVARVPAGWLNAALAIYSCMRRSPAKKMNLYDLARARCSSRLTRWLARQWRVPVEAANP